MDEKRLPFLAHLEELKVRIMRSLYGLVVGVVACFIFKDQIWNFIAAPLVSVMQRPEVHIQSPIETFFVYLKLALIAGIIVTAPWIFLQVWLFVAPGLYKNERRMATSFVFFGTFFFFGGVAFGYYVVLPFGFSYLLGMAYDSAGYWSVLEQVGKVFHLAVDYQAAGFVRAAIKPTIMMESYVSLVLKLLLAFGLVFELPLVLYFLAKIGMVTHRGLLKFFRFWVVLSFLISAVLTPPDVFTQTLMAGPLIVMYLSGIVVAWVITTRRERREAKELGYDDDEDDLGDSADPGDDEPGPPAASDEEPPASSESDEPPSKK